MPNVNSGKDVSALYEQRRKNRDAEIALYTQVEMAIKGHIPTDYQRLFTESDVKLQLRTIRSADDSLTKFLSEIPILPHVPSLGKRESDTSRTKAENVEKVIFGYHNGSAMRGGVDFSGIAFQLARHQVRFGDGCLVANPDSYRKLVYLEAIHPKHHYPPDGWHSFAGEPLDKTLLMFEMTLGECKARFACDDTEMLISLSNAFKPKAYGVSAPQAEDSVKVKVGIYRSRDAWYAVAMGGDKDVVLLQSETGDRGHPGVCGVVSLKQFESEPLFLGTIGLEAGLMKVLNQQIQNTERINKATTIGPPLLNDQLVIGGYNEVNMALMQGRTFQPYRMAPDSPNNLHQVMASLLSLSQMFNYNPESNMGSGQAVSGKAINQLQAGPRTLVTNILFAPYKPAFPRIYDDCMDMELNLWPNDKKTIVGKAGKANFEVDYIPNTALKGFKGRVRIEDARPGGYNAFLEAVQKHDAGMASLRDLLEADPDTGNVEETIRRIETEQTSGFLKAAFEGLGSSDPLQGMKLAAELLNRIQSGKSRDEAIQDMLAAGLLEPPAPEPEMGGALPPEVAAMLGGGGEEMGAIPSLAEARGF